jgi:hypothetical protein
VVLAGGGIPFERYQPWVPSAEDLEAYSGPYYSPELDAVYTLTVEDGRLVLSHRRRGREPLQPLDVGSFRSGFLGTLVFESGGAAPRNGFQASVGRVKNLAFVRGE